MKLIKRIIPELARWAVIAALFAPFAYAASGDKWSIQASPGNSRSITAGQELARYDSEGRYATYDGRDIHLPVAAFTLSTGLIRGDNNDLGAPYLGFWGEGNYASGALIWPTISSREVIYMDRMSDAQISFRVPSDYNSSLTDRFKLVVQNIWPGSRGMERHHSSHAGIRLDYNYTASTISAAGDSTPTDGTRAVLTANSYPQEITLSAPDALVAGGWCTLRIWRSWDGFTIGQLRVIDAVYQYNVAN